jgi:5-methylcytosine-specific restriction endonuclease McrA
VEITLKQMQVDHIEPHWHTLTEQQAKKSGINKGSHDISNLNPSCSRCNKWKSTWTLEQFRDVVETSLDRLERDTPNFRLAKDYGLLTIQKKPVIFYFENIITKEK